MFSATILQMIYTVFSTCANWFVRVMDSMRGAPIWLGGVFIWIIYKSLLKPLFGDAGSDKARRNSGAKQSGDK